MKESMRKPVLFFMDLMVVFLAVILTIELIAIAGFTFPFMETGHRVIKMSGMRISRLISRLYILKFCLGMSYRSQNTFCRDIFTELHGSGKFRCGIPTFDTACFFQ